MVRRVDVLMAETVPAVFSGAGTNYLVRTSAGVLYAIYQSSLSDVVFRKSSDGGLSWTTPTDIVTGTLTQLAVWYDKWSGLSTGLIHCVYVGSGTDDCFYRTIDTENSDALSTETTVFLGGSTANGGHISVTRAAGGNVYCKVCIDAGAEGGFFRLPNANVPNGAWDAARTVNEALATQDQMILLPDLTAADNQDILAIFWDASANEISRQLYDDSANTWSETSIATSMNDQVATTAYPHFAAAMDLTNSQVILIAWNGIDIASARLRCWSVTNSTITALTDVVSSSTDDQGLSGLAINESDANHWWAFYGGKTDGSETYQSSLNIYCKTTRDAGSTWGAETLLTHAAASLRTIIRTPRCTEETWGVLFFDDQAVDELRMIARADQPHLSIVGVL